MRIFFLVPAVFGIVCLSPLHVAAQAISQAGARTYDLDRCVNTFNPAAIESTQAGYQYWFADRKFLDGRTLKLSVVRPHEATHPPHAHPEDEFFFVLEGRAEFCLDGRTKVVHPYTSLYCPPNVKHGIRNVGDGELKYLVIKKYPTFEAGAAGANAIAMPVSPNRMTPPVDTSFTTWSAWQKLRAQYPAAVPAVVPASREVRVWENLVYTAYGDRHLSLDLFAPEGKGKGPFPGVLIIHGGGWRSGNRKQEIPMARELATHGYVAVLVEYRLSPEAQYPAGVHDLKAALRWMRAHAHKYMIDSSRIGVMGGSAGGTLAALLGTTGDLKEFEGAGTYPGYSSAVQAVVDIDGVVDFTDSSESGKDSDPAKPSAGKLWFGSAYRDRPDLWREASPLTWVGPRTPSIIFINSSIPRFHAGRDAMIAQLNALHIASEVHTLPDSPHPFWLFQPWFDEASRMVISFFDRVLKKGR